MNILLLSCGGGGGNILRSLGTLFARDVEVVQQTDAEYAGRLRGAVTTRFLDTNEFALAQVPEDERVLIGATTTQRLGSRHDPELARRALDESRGDIERLIAQYRVIILIGTGGKGTGAGTIFPLAQMARQQKKLVLPVFVRPSFERHEVDKRRYDHALHVAGQFDAAGIRLIEILNDRAYSDSDPQPQAVVWERMNLPIARGLRALLYVLWDLSQVDPSDLSILLAGHGRMRIGFAEIDPPDASDPSDADVSDAVDECWHGTYCAFSKPVGTSLVCIQGDWSNLADAKIKGGIAALALGDDAGRPYNPLYARASHTPRPWGVTALFAEYTGVHDPLVIDWTLASSDAPRPATLPDSPAPEIVEVPEVVEPPSSPSAVEDVVAWEELPAIAVPDARPYPTLIELAKAVNRWDPPALAFAAGDPGHDIAFDGFDVRKLLCTSWFRGAFAHFSEAWRERLLSALSESVVIQNHAMRIGRRSVLLKDLRYEQMAEISATTLVLGPEASDLQLLLAIGQLWGEQAFDRLQFVDVCAQEHSSRLASILGLRV